MREVTVLGLPGAPDGMADFARHLCGLRIGCRVSLIESPDAESSRADYLLLGLEKPDATVIESIRRRFPAVAVILVLADHFSETGLLQRVQEAGAHEYLRVGDCDSWLLRRALDSAEVNRDNERLRNRYQVLLERNPDGFWINDLQGRILEVNPAFCGMIGHDRARLLEMAIPDLEVRETAEETAAHIAYVVEHGSDHFQTMLRHADGHVVHMDVSAHRVDEGNEIRLMVIFRDISEQVALARAREESDRRFRDVAEAAAEYIWEVDRDGRYRFVTATISEVLGRPVEAVLGHSPMEFMPEEDAVAVQALLARHVARSESWRNLEHRSVQPDGRIVWQRVSGLPIFDSEHRLVGFRGTARDITEERAAAEARARLTERLQLATSAAGLGIWDYEITTGRLDWDDGMLRIYGVAADDFDGRFETWRAALTEDTLDRALGDLETGLSSERPYASEFSIRRQDGAIRQIRALARAIRDDSGTVIRVVGINEDITDRKAVQQALQRSEAELAEAQQIAHLGNWVSDFVSGEIRWSDEVYRIFGLAPTQWAATHEAFMQAVHPDDRERVGQAVNESLQPGGPVYDIEHRILRPDGTVRHVYQRGHVEFDPAGKPLRMVGVVLDITERRALEEALRRQRDTAHGIIDSLPGIFYMLSPEQRLALWNRNLNAVTGRDDEGLGESPMLDLVVSEDRERVESALSEALRAGSARLEARLLATEDQARPYDLSIHRLVLDGQALLIGNGIDISDRVRLEAELRRLATTDPLTGLFNRRHFMELAQKAHDEASHTEGSLALIMLDIDHFKSVNDGHGHEAGDRVLRDVSATILDAVRADGSVGRLGGEEFAVLLPEADHQAACVVAERIRQRIGGSRVPIRGGMLSVTASLGVAACEDAGDTVDRMLSRADGALYQAKEAGRDCVRSG
ncbi:MAG: sensor domain-containing diguanylate cyclase [Halothiobacillaceae bacterium]